MGYEEDGTEQHRSYVVVAYRLEEVAASAGAVADVVPDLIGDHCWVAGVVLGYPLLYLTDEVCADVRGLGEYASTELGEESGEACAEAESDYDVWVHVDVHEEADAE